MRHPTLAVCDRITEYCVPTFSRRLSIYLPRSTNYVLYLSVAIGELAQVLYRATTTDRPAISTDLALWRGLHVFSLLHLLWCRRCTSYILKTISLARLEIPTFKARLLVFGRLDEWITYMRQSNMAGMTLQFIDQGTKGISRSERRIIRSHVMTGKNAGKPRKSTRRQTAPVQAKRLLTLSSPPGVGCSELRQPLWNDLSLTSFPQQLDSESTKLMHRCIILLPIVYFTFTYIPLRVL